MKLFLSPHNDDETLFGFFTILSEKPLVIVVTDSCRQWDRGERITSRQRINETKAAMRLAGARVEFLHLPDSNLSVQACRQAFAQLSHANVVYAPAHEHAGNPDHNIVAEASRLAFGDRVVHYMTYAGTSSRSRGQPVSYTVEMMQLKKKALACYQSQMTLSTTKRFFLTNNIEYLQESSPSHT